jgi:hypothetical protein
LHNALRNICNTLLLVVLIILQLTFLLLICKGITIYLAAAPIQTTIVAIIVLFKLFHYAAYYIAQQR